MLTTQAERFSKEEVMGSFKHSLYPSSWALPLGGSMSPSCLKHP